MSGATYDRIGRDYASARKADPRIAAQIDAALGDAATVLNVGAGTGSYEPVGRKVTALEPSARMIGQRPAGSAPAVRASAERLPFDGKSFDAAMAIFSDHHWTDRPAGLREMRRVARDRVLIVNADPSAAERFWLTRDYLRGLLDLIPDRYRSPGYWEEEFQRLLGRAEVQPVPVPVPVPHDCRDGFYQAYWRRPRAYLDRRVRDGISVFHALPAAEVSAAVDRLQRDLGDGGWDERNGALLDRRELDVGLRLVSVEIGASRANRHSEGQPLPWRSP